MKTRHFLGGVIILLIGLILLANNFGFLSWGVWYELWRLWPLILIAIGLDLLLKGTSLSFLRILPPLLIIAGVCYAVYISRGEEGFPRFEKEEIQTITLTQPLLSHIKKATINLNFGAGILKVESGSGEELMKGEFTVSKGIKPWIKYRDKGEERFVEIGSHFTHLWRGENSWKIRLNSTIPLSLKVDTGASSNDLDLSSLRITEFELNTGASKNNIKFGKINSIHAEIDGGASSIKILIPRSIGVRIKTDMALATHNFDTLGFEKKGDIYFSENYSTADKTLDLDLDVGVSNLKIEFY